MLCVEKSRFFYVLLFAICVYYDLIVFTLLLASMAVLIVDV